MGNLTLVHLVNLLAVWLAETGMFILFQTFLPEREWRQASWNNNETPELIKREKNVNGVR